MLLQESPIIHRVPIGIVSLGSHFAKVPGHNKHATTFSFTNLQSREGGDGEKGC
jgi:hypothetical protein